MNIKPGNPNATQEMGEILFIRRDYFHHIVAFLALGGLYGFAAHTPHPIFRRHPVFFGAVLLTGLAVILEAVQFIVPYRKFNWNDMLANIAGLLIGVGIIVLLTQVPLLQKTIFSLKSGQDHFNNR